MNLEYKDGLNKNEAMVYEGATTTGSHRIIMHRNRTHILVPTRILAHLLTTMEHLNIPSNHWTKELWKGLTKEEVHWLASSRTLTHHQQELMSWKHRLYTIPFPMDSDARQKGHIPKMVPQMLQLNPHFVLLANWVVHIANCCITYTKKLGESIQ